MANILPYGLGAPGMGMLGPVAGGRGGMRGGTLGLAYPKPMQVPVTQSPRGMVPITPRTSAMEPFLRTIPAPRSLPPPRTQALPPPRTAVAPRGNIYEGSLGDKMLKGPAKVSKNWCKANPIQCASMVTAGAAVVDEMMDVDFPDVEDLPLPEEVDAYDLDTETPVEDGDIDLSAPNAEKEIGLGIEDDSVVMGADTEAPNAEKEIGLGADSPAGPITKEVTEQIEKGGSKGFMGWLDDTMKDDTKFGHLLAGLNAMRGRPDQNIAALAKDMIERGAATRSTNRTADMLEKQGVLTPQQAQMVRSGMKPKDVLALNKDGDKTAAYKNYVKAKKEGFPGTFMDYQQQVSPKQYETTFEKEAGKSAVGKLELIHETATNAPQIIAKSDEVIRMVDSGAATGLLANVEQAINKFVGDVLGGKDALRDATATERLEALMGSEVFPMIKQLGIGARGLDTPAERQFLLKVMAGEIKMTPEAIKMMAMDRKKRAQSAVNTYNQYVGEGRFDKLSRTQNLPYDPINQSSAFSGFSIAR